MDRVEDGSGEAEALREQLTLLGEARSCINESLDVEFAMQSTLEGARVLTGAQYGLILLYDESGAIVDQFFSGMTSEQAAELWTMPDGPALHEHLATFKTAFRLRDLHSHIVDAGLPKFRPSLALDSVVSFLAAPILCQDERVGAIYLSGDRREFSSDVEEILPMLAAQAALVISNARQLREEIRARAYLETLLNLAPVGVLVLDAETAALTSVNREATRIVGDLVAPGSSIQDLLEAATVRTVDGRGVLEAETAFANALRSREGVRAEEIVIDTPDGRSVTVVANATPIRASGETVDTVVVTLQDMTPLEELERLRAEFLGIVGHELRTPLTSIKGSAITLLEAPSTLDPAEVVQYYRIINEQADHMRGLITDLIDIVRIETGTLSIAPEPSDVATLLDEARNLFLSAGGRGTVRVNVAPDLPTVMADRRRFVQVVNNLLSNAARNSHETSVIRLEAVHEGTHLAISITDKGRGVPAERLPYLFQKFTPEDSDQNRDLGLGLAICKGIVEAHGGRIWAESDGLGLGSRFTFTLLASEEPLRTRSRPSELSTSDDEDSKTRVLVIDDDPRALKLVRDALSIAGYEPIVTGDPKHAASLVDETRPGVVLLDLMLPGTDGIELMRKILDSHDVPVIFLSAYDQDELIARAFEMGAVDYIVKPFAPTELAARVKAALRKQANPSSSYSLGDLAINYAGRRVEILGRVVDLTPTEYGVLVELSTNPGIVRTHDQLLQRVWGPAKVGDARPLRTVVKNLRRQLGDKAKSPQYIQTVPHVGYRMPKPVVSELAETSP